MRITHRDLMHAAAASRIPAGEGWIFELKYDGFRCLALRDRDKVRLLSRSGRDMAACFPEIVQEFAGLPDELALDGELVVLDARGVPQWERLARRSRISRAMLIMDAAKREPAAYFVFDVLWVEGRDQRGNALEERKKLLRWLLSETRRIRPVGDVDRGEEAYVFAGDNDFEGIVAKHLESKYIAGKTDRWVKIKTPAGAERERRRYHQPATRD